MNVQLPGITKDLSSVRAESFLSYEKQFCYQDQQ